MRCRLFYFAALSTLLPFALSGCGNKQETSEAPAPASAPAGVPVDAATAGSISGTVQLDGTPPKMKTINMAAEPACAKLHPTPVTSQEVLAGKNGALENVVVYLKGDFSQYKFDTPQTPVTITQKGCMYDPHVLALETGQSLQVVNADPVTHNIHPIPKDNREWNESQPPGAPPIDQSFCPRRNRHPREVQHPSVDEGLHRRLQRSLFRRDGKRRFFRFEKCAAGNITHWWPGKNSTARANSP